MQKIKKAVILMAGLGTRFLPLSKILPKENFPLLDKPLFYYIVKEVVDSGISEIIFVVSPQSKFILNYFKSSPELEKNLKGNNKENILKELKDLNEIYKKVSFKCVLQKKPLGDGQAVLLTKKLANKEPVAVLFVDDIIEAPSPCLFQLTQIFKTCSLPIIALSRIPKEKISCYGTVKVEKIASRLYKIKKIVEKPKPEEIPSDLAITGRYILTPEVFEYLEKVKPSQKKELILGKILDKMIEDGKMIYGYEFKGKWLECGDKDKWIKSFLYLASKEEKFRDYLKNL